MSESPIPAIHRRLQHYFETTDSPVARLMAERTHDPFRVLVTTILSARTKDQTTSATAEALFAEVESLDDLRKIPFARLDRLIWKVGFHRAKARNLKLLPDAVDTLFGGAIPQTVEELIQLPGVGRKTANLVMTDAFDKPGICVDVHVHRICNRLGLVRTRTPVKTEMALRQLLPMAYWKTWNHTLVAFGQTLCLPVRPQCGNCPLQKYCKRVGVKTA